MIARSVRVPARIKPLVIGSLAHQSFRSSLRKFVRDLLLEHRFACIPLHIPKAGVVEARWRSIAEELHSFREFTSLWRPERPYECACSRFATLLPVGSFSDSGHVAVAGHLLVGLSEVALATASANSNETVFPEKSTFVQAAQRSIHSFWKQNSIGTQPWGGAQSLRQRVHRWAANEWASHSTAVQNRRLISKYHVDELKNEYGSLVWHCSDHCYTQLVGYCPALYSHLLWKTFFASPDVFRTELTSASVAHVALQEAVPDIVRRSCRWAFRGKFDAVLPPAYCIP